MTERLPLGSLLRDKDFRTDINPLMLDPTPILGRGASNLARTFKLEQKEIALTRASAGVGPGSILVHVDGEQSDYSLTSNFRTTRGGSVYVGGGSHPGGAVIEMFPPINMSWHTNILLGKAYLVRNAPTMSGVSQVSAGGELMLLILTYGHLYCSTDSLFTLSIGTNGTGEGWAAADLYRITGRPLEKVSLNPIGTITLANRSY